MQLTYYNNKSDRRYLNKDITQISLEGHDNPVTISILDATDIVNPIFKVRDVDLYMTANYCFVDSLHRYYFIDDITLDNGFAFLHCSVDVLMTYKEGLLDQEVVVTRQEEHVDFYQNDERYRIEQRTAKRTIAFSGGDANGFDFSNQQFILGVVGDNS